MTTRQATKLLGFALCIIFITFSSTAVAQQPKKVPVVGVLSGRGVPMVTAPDPNADAFRQTLRELGYIENQKILLEYRYTEGRPGNVPSLVAELVQLRVDVLVLTAPSVIRAATQATKTIPIVIVTTQDPVANGLVDSLARPGGNITGVTRLTRELSGKRLEIFKEIIPTVSQIGVLWVGDPAATSNVLKEHEATALSLKMRVESLEVRRPSPDLDGAFQAAIKKNLNGLIIATNRVLLPYINRIGDLAIKNQLPSVCEARVYVEAGCTLSYSANEAESFKRAAWYVDKILKGAKPAALPIEQPIKFELVINLKTAKQIGLTIPPNVLARADKVIK